MAFVLILLAWLVAAIVVFRSGRGEGVIGFAFMFSLVHALFVFPQVAAFSLSDSHMAGDYRAPATGMLTAWMATSCYLAGMAGYGLAAPRNPEIPVRQLDDSWQSALTAYALWLGAISIGCFLLLATRMGGLQGYFLEAEFYNMELRGANVWLLFGARFIYLALAAAAIALALRPNWPRLALCLALMVFPLMNVLLLFRRSDLLFLGYALAFATIGIAKLRINRATTFGMALLLALAIISFPDLRRGAIGSVASATSLGTSLSPALLDHFALSDGDEVIVAAETIDFTRLHDRFQYGAFLWDSLVMQFLPSSLLGPETKAALYLRADNRELERLTSYDFGLYRHVAPMGFSEAYQQFAWLGGVIFLGIGAFLGRLHAGLRDPRTLLFYVAAIPYACLAATNDIATLPAKLLFLYVMTRGLGLFRGPIALPAGGAIRPRTDRADRAGRF